MKWSLQGSRCGRRKLPDQMGIVVGSEQSVAPATSPELYVTQFPPKKMQILKGVKDESSYKAAPHHWYATGHQCGTLGLAGTSAPFILP